MMTSFLPWIFPLKICSDSLSFHSIAKWLLKGCFIEVILFVIFIFFLPKKSWIRLAKAGLAEIFLNRLFINPKPINSINSQLLVVTTSI
jgi:hypothetical protein